jgi:GTP pyrophosphokinase
MRERFGYRIVKAEWTNKSHGTKYTVMLHVVGNNDIGIVTNITSVISKETDVSLRSINIESNDGLFACTLTVMVNDISRMETLIKRLTTIRGVKQVNRY